MTERSDIDLMLAFQAGDEQAFSVLVERHRQAVVNFTYRYLGNRADAEDLAQEVFVRVFRARGRYRPTAKFTTWMYRIAVNACLNEARSRRLRPTFAARTLPAGSEEAGAPVLADANARSPSESASRAELQAQVRDAVDRLPERQRLALLLNKFHGLGYEELAGTLDLSIPAVKSLLVRARENVRAILEPVLGHAPRAVPGRRGSP